MKKLFEFTINKEQEVEEVTTTQNEQGQDVKTITKVKQKVPQKFFIAKPNRRLIDDADLFYGVVLSEGIQAGLLTRQLLAKRYANDGGAMSEPEKKNYANSYLLFISKQEEYQKLASKPEATKTTEDNEKIKGLLSELNDLRELIQDYELQQISLYDQTAESRARNKTILWWVLMLSHKVENDKEEPVFGTGTYAERLEKYDSYEENDDSFLNEVVNRFTYFISFWYLGRASTAQDFSELEKRQFETEKS